MEDDSHDAVKVSELVERLNKVESENKSLKTLLVQLENRLGVLEKKTGIKSSFVNTNSKPLTPTVVKKNDDDFDLFDDDEEDSEEKQRIKEERLKQYADKKAGKKEVIAKSSILLDVKPWDDETDMKALEAAVRGITIDGLIWGQSKLIPVAYGVKKLQIGCVIEDDKVSTEALDEQICAFDDYVQSVDIAAFNKI
jgi:translation elongation factor EF-1beta